MTTETIQRAARAVWERDLPEGETAWDHLSEATRAMYRREVEIAFETLRDPSEEILQAMWQAFFDADGSGIELMRAALRAYHMKVLGREG